MSLCFKYQTISSVSHPLRSTKKELFNMIFLKICYSIIKKNKGFSLCLFLMSVLCVIVSFLAANFSKSAAKTFDDYFVNSGTPDALISTEVEEIDSLSYILEIDGVKKIDTRLIIDGNIETKEEKQFASRLITYSKDGEYKLTIHQNKEIESDLPKISIYYSFAEFNNINPGDEITICSPLGSIECIVESTISTPETISCVKDDFSSYENYEFCYLYISKEEFNNIVPSIDMTNSILVYFDDGLSLDKQKETLARIEESLGSSLLSSNLIKDSSAFRKIDEDIETINVLCILIPGIVMLVTLGFSFIFIKIIIENQKNTIALLKSLGYSSKKVISIFVLFTILINILALILGAPLGYLTIRLCVLLIAKADGVLSISMAFSPLLTVGLVLLVFSIGIIASLFTSKSISKIDPSTIKSSDIDNRETPKIAKAIRTNPFVKISLVSTLKNYKRLIIGALCMAFCIIAIGVGLEGVLANAYHADSVYGERFTYDLMVRDFDEEDYLEIKSNVSGIKIIEPAALFTTTVNGSKVNVSSYPETNELVNLKDKNGTDILPGDGVVIDEMYSVINKVNVGDKITLGSNEIEVTGVARELLNTYFYVSEQTAKDIFSKPINCVYIKAENSEDIINIKNDIVSINSTAYFTLLSEQNRCLADRTVTMQLVMFVFAILSFLMGSLFIINMSIIDFNEKKSKYATLRALGASVNKICVVSLIENLLRLFFGIIVALPLSYVMCQVIVKQMSNQYRQYISVNYWGCILSAIGISLIYIIISYLVSKRKIRKMDILEKLNEVE